MTTDRGGISTDDLHALLKGISALVPQELEKQNIHKLSYYLPLEHDHRTVIADIKVRLEARNIRANLIWGVDEIQNIGLLDILPASANKLHAITVLMQTIGFDYTQTIFAGDSGNDIDVLLSPIRSVLVAKADEGMRDGGAHASPENLYLAGENFLNMNGCYSAGVFEGTAHYRPEFIPVIEGLQ